ncbi:5-amino-6-uracil reductase-like protein [Dothidotthia symphoricarpi CBS 119687]|uniref:2,5-diamino-6-ribosylamino-4(3H)-pyrimidinone 5'-phosphate reductase n=1 Tax=Dothidotthia symphoricarpi CBS 119687 TaxID=1392245 RepID=A0A6A6AHP4_9PLEO|nr:5-amino-6-uracil reductase-like protein [Dothidotthia symphoricarpi CBS 119687]KAF2130615.1 5-amino-6-uracil reductase-like protein [Dothidotthia symphoricarpi CBS 119687]
MAAPREALYFPASQRQQLDSYLPSPSITSTSSVSSKPHVTLTFATSLDSQLALAPGVQTALSGPESKAMTHYLRSKHDAILIGVGTAIADNPSLNCRIEGVGGYGGEGLYGQPRPIVLDPKGRWEISAESKVVKLAREGKGKAPWIITKTDVGEQKRSLLESVGGKFLRYGDSFGGVEASLSARMEWRGMLQLLSREGIQGVMIEGGGVVINDLLSADNLELVDSVILTIAPTWLGRGGVQVCPEQRQGLGRSLPAGRLKDVNWMPLGEDVVLCGRPQ